MWVSWVNSAQSLRPLPIYCLCCVWPMCSAATRDLWVSWVVGKFRTIVAAVAGGVVCVVFGPMCGARLLGKFRTINLLRPLAVAGFLFVSCLGRWCSADIRAVRHQATDFANSTFRPQSIEGQIEGQWFPDQPSNELPSPFLLIFAHQHSNDNLHHLSGCQPPASTLDPLGRTATPN